MFNIFGNKKDKARNAEPIIKGRLESTLDELKNKFGQKLAGRIYELDVHELAPYLTKEKYLPKAIQASIREVMDDYLKEGEDYYFLADSKKFGILITKGNKMIADLKFDVLRNELSRVIKNVHDGTIPKSQKEIIESEAPLQTNKSFKDSLSSKGTLSERPDEEEIKKWASRAMQRMSSNYVVHDLQADVFRLAELVKLKYYPVWYTNNKIISGYAVKKKQLLIDEDYPGKAMHEDIAILGAAINALRKMHENKQYALLIVPVNVSTICDNHTQEIYSIYCRSIEPQLKKFLILQIKGIEKANLNQADWERIKVLTYHCRSMIVDIGSKVVSPKDMLHINFHSYGFDVSTLEASEHDLIKLTNKFCDYYDQQHKETFILGIKTNSMLIAALGAGFSYISGEAVSEPLDAPKHASYMNLEDIYSKKI